MNLYLEFGPEGLVNSGGVLGSFMDLDRVLGWKSRQEAPQTQGPRWTNWASK